MSLVRGLAATLASVGLAWTAFAAGASGPIRLIMVEERGCRYCMKWDAEVGLAYPESREGRFAPLLRVGRDASALGSFAPIVYTPTFIVSRSGEEMGRITGYPGESYFWEELAVILGRAGLEAE